MIIAKEGISIINNVLQYLPERYPKRFPVFILLLLNDIKPTNMLFDTNTYLILKQFREKYSHMIGNEGYFQNIRQPLSEKGFGTVWQTLNMIKNSNITLNLFSHTHSLIAYNIFIPIRLSKIILS